MNVALFPTKILRNVVHSKNVPPLITDRTKNTIFKPLVVYQKHLFLQEAATFREHHTEGRLTYREAIKQRLGKVTLYQVIQSKIPLLLKSIYVVMFSNLFSVNIFEATQLRHPTPNFPSITRHVLRLSCDYIFRAQKGLNLI